MDLNFNKNEDHNKLLVSDLKNRFSKVKVGGGEKRIVAQHGKKKLTARERIEYFFDEGWRGDEYLIIVSVYLHQQQSRMYNPHTVIKQGGRRK